MDRKIKVVLLCHYWSDEMAEMVGRKHYFQELSPWIQETLNLFKNKNDIDFHVVAPNYASNTDLDCQRDGIFFHFYHYSPTWLSKISAPIIKKTVKHAEPFKIAERLANTLTGFRTPTKNAVKIIRAINPDLIHLYGSENPDYSTPALKLLKEFPVIVTIQGYACLQSSSGSWIERRFYDYRVKFERDINNSVEYATSSQKISLEEFKNNKRVNFYGNVKKLFYVQTITKVPQVNAVNVEKKFDLVYYARIDKNKGVEDLIDVVSYLKNRGRPLNTLIMGRGGEDYVVHLKRIIKDKCIDDIVDFAGFIENHEDVYKLAAQARLMVLPTHNDGIPNTIREAMFMRLPVVANNVGGIPRFNQNRHCVHLVELGKLEDLAAGICKVLDDADYRNELIENAHQEAIEVYSPDAVYEQMVAAYKDVVKQIKKK